MKKHILVIGAVAALFSSMTFTSCNFLDQDDNFNAIFKEDSIFHSAQNANGYLYATPTMFPSAGSIWGGSWNPGETASDEICVRWQTGEFWGAQFTVGNVNPEKVFNWGQWYSMYKIINRCNRMLANVDKVGDMSTNDKEDYKAMVHFIRGYAYYILLQNWGPCLILGDEIVSTSEKAEYYDRERATMDESIDYICNEFAQSLPGLKRPSEQSTAYFGRPTKGTALALIARLRLIQASPTFNGGTYAKRCFGEWKRKSDGKFYVNQDYDAKRWAVAAAAAKQVIDLDYYTLFTVDADKDNPYPLDASVPTAKFPDGAGGIDPYHSFADMFNGEGTPKVNRELIWADESSSDVKAYSRHSFPVNYGGWGGMSVPQRVIDCFLMKDGKKPSESPLYESDLTKHLTKKQSVGDCDMANGTPLAYVNRSARFYASIGFPGRIWKMNSTTDGSYNNQTFWYSVDDSKAGKNAAGNNPNDYCISGYVPFKYIHPDDSWHGKDGAAVINKPFPIIRYAEILLAYCEAANHVQGAETVKTWDGGGRLVDVAVSRDEAAMARYFNMIRYRVGLPGADAATLSSEAAFDEVIKNERQVELFNEGHRYFDTRRWGTYFTEDANSSNWRGLDVYSEKKGNNDGPFFNLVTINEQNIRDRRALPRMVFLPLQHSELLKSPKMDQNPGWDR